jgi:hypothetical protein
MEQVKVKVKKNIIMKEIRIIANGFGFGKDFLRGLR